MTKASQTMSVFQQVNSNPSKHHRTFDRMTMTFPRLASITALKLLRRGRTAAPTSRAKFFLHH